VADCWAREPNVQTKNKSNTKQRETTARVGSILLIMWSLRVAGPRSEFANGDVDCYRCLPRDDKKLPDLPLLKYSGPDCRGNSENVF
jgi:hypothetical protein